MLKNASIFLIVNNTNSNSLKALKTSILDGAKDSTSYTCAQDYLKINKQESLISQIELPQNQVKLTLDRHEQIKELVGHKDNGHLRVLLKMLPTLTHEISQLNQAQRIFFSVIRTFIQNKRNTLLNLKTSLLSKKDLYTLLAAIQEHSKQYRVNFYIESDHPEYILDITSSILIIKEDFSLKQIELNSSTYTEKKVFQELFA